MAQLRIEEAIAFHNGKQQTQNMKKKKPLDEGLISGRTISALLWPESKESTRDVNMASLKKGTTKRIEPAWVHTICMTTGVDPNFLFGWEK